MSSLHIAIIRSVLLLSVIGTNQSKGSSILDGQISSWGVGWEMGDGRWWEMVGLVRHAAMLGLLLPGCHSLRNSDFQRDTAST